MRAFSPRHVYSDFAGTGSSHARRGSFDSLRVHALSIDARTRHKKKAWCTTRARPLGTLALSTIPNVARGQNFLGTRATGQLLPAPILPPSLIARGQCVVTRENDWKSGNQCQSSWCYADHLIIVCKWKAETGGQRTLR